MMKRLSSLILLTLMACHCCHAQSTPFAYSIVGKEVAAPDSCEVWMIYYSSAFCHGCMVELVRDGLKWQNEAPNRQVYVLIRGGDLSSMRPESTAAVSFFPKDRQPKVVFDLNPDTSLRYEKRYDIARFPVLLTFDQAGVCTYHPFEELFKE